MINHKIMDEIVYYVNDIFLIYMNKWCFGYSREMIHFKEIYMFDIIE